jgi:hypothetical protein
LVVVTLSRLWLVVFAHPAVGFGNNFDFVRQSSCVGLWEDYGDQPKINPHLHGPVTRLVFDGDRRKNLCLASDDNVFSYLAAHTHRKHDRVDLREVGFWKALLASAILITMAVSALSQGATVFVLCAAALALGDLDALSYLNTLYLEFSVLLAGVAALAVCALCLGREKPPVQRDVWLAVAAIAWLGAAKQQYGGLAIGLAAITAADMLLRWGHNARVQAGAILAAGIGAVSLFGALNTTNDGLLVAGDYANRTDTFLGAVLPAARDRDLALRIVGLPASCRAAIGTTWYTIGLNHPHPCPAVLHLSRGRLLPLFVEQPTTLTIPMLHVATLSQRPALNEPTRWEDDADTRRLRYRLIEYSSPTYLLERLSPGAYKTIVAAASVLGMAAFVLVAWRAAVGRGARSCGLPMAGLGGFTLFYTLASTAFGDGFQDVHRHAVLLPAAILFIFVGSTCWIGQRFVRMGKNKLPGCAAKVLFSVTDEAGDTMVETLWAQSLGDDRYELHNLPFYASGVSFQDIVHAPFSTEQKFPTFEKVLSKSGNRTIRIIMDPPVQPGNESDQLLQKLVEMGCGYEGANRSLIVINIPPLVRLADVADFLVGSGMEWEYADPTYEELHPEGT